MITNTSTQWAVQDEEIERRIVEQIRELKRPPLRHIQVGVENGKVTLKGRVDSFYEKQLCLGCLRSIAGVDGVSDQIEVR